MHHPYDDLAKKIGSRALAASGATTVEHTIPRSTQRADIRHDPDPAREAERALLGLLGRIVRSLCLLEIYGHMPHGAEWRACLGKHFAHWEAWARRVRAENRKQRAKGQEPEPFIEPMLWILAVAFSKPMRRKLDVKTRPGWPKGVYFHGRDVYRVGIVVANELPRDRSTLLVRFMVAGPLLKDAIEDLAELPANAIERGLVEGDLVDLERTLGAKPSRTPQEEEIVAMVTALRSDLSWTHLREIIAIDDPLKRGFYVELCRHEGWSTRALQEKIAGMLYERTAISKRPAAVVKQAIVDATNGAVVGDR